MGLWYIYPLLAIATRSRPSFLARYNAASATRSTASPVKPCSGKQATPQETVIAPTGHGFQQCSRSINGK